MVYPYVIEYAHFTCIILSKNFAVLSPDAIGFLQTGQICTVIFNHPNCRSKYNDYRYIDTGFFSLLFDIDFPHFQLTIQIPGRECKSYACAPFRNTYYHLLTGCFGWVSCLSCNHFGLPFTTHLRVQSVQIHNSVCAGRWDVSLTFNSVSQNGL